MFKSSIEKESTTISKQNEIFEELANERINEIQELSKQIDFNNLIYFVIGKSVQKYYLS